MKQKTTTEVGKKTKNAEVSVQVILAQLNILLESKCLWGGVRKGA